MPNNSSKTNPAVAILKGISLGDRIGGPTELARIVHESLSARKFLDVEDLAGRYLDWWRSGAFDTGPIFALTMTRIASGMGVKEAAEDVHRLLNGMTAGCGPAQRIAPLAACPTIPTSKIAAAARAEAQITHHHPHAGDAAAIVALLCRYLVEGFILERALELVEREEPVAWVAVHSATLSPGGYSFDVVRSALFFLDAKNPLEKSFEFAGPQNYCPVVVGAIEGAIQLGSHPSNSRDTGA